MPQDRLLHPKASHSAKVTMLTDLEFRVWTQYLLSADDFGVMRCSAVTLQADNDALHGRPAKVVQRALERLVTVALVRPFEHQGHRYVYQPDWQSYQKIEWPRTTNEPKPPLDAEAVCDEATRELFDKHPGGTSRRKPKQIPSDLGRASQILPEHMPSTSQILSEHMPDSSQASRARGPAKRLTLTANGSSEKNEALALELRAGELLHKYEALFYVHRRGARYHKREGLDFPKAQELVRTWTDDARLEKLAVLVLTTDDDWISRTDRGFGIFAAKASWADDRLAAWEADHSADSATGAGR